TMSSYIYEVIKPEADIPVKCFSYRDPMGFFVTSHWHNSIEILRIAEGKMHVTIGNKRELLEQGMVMVINSREIHSTFGEPHLLAEVVQIPYPFLKRYLPNLDQRIFTKTPILPSGIISAKDRLPENDLYANDPGSLIHQMCQLTKHKEGDYLVSFHACLFQLIHCLFTWHSTQISLDVTTQDDINRKRLTKVMNYVNIHYRDKITLEEVASLLAFNKEYFCRFFKRYMGMTFLEYVNEVRFSHVCSDLFSKEDNIIQILEEHGFTNYKLFIKMFKERYHSSPSQKRKEHTF
ncbi:AraC family transcriptional regulator, partial [Lachnospiraceae bacterium OttesenSCG-928-D06]|nr:AraC family transcriptional regulator [Lachnospiraceae bacterium OttesenSCG-928-D06]